MLNFPVLLKTGDQEEPAAAIHYVAASNGLFHVSKTPFYRAVTRTPGPVPGLLPEEESLRLDCPPLPAALIEEVLAFFADVHRVHDGEAIVILFYDHSSGRYRVGVPPQTVSGYYRSDGRWRAYYQLKYGSVARPEGFLRVGTIHSHADLPAYSSAVDCDDERFEDGLHIVFGELDRAQPSRSVAFASNGKRFPLAAATWLEPAWVPERPARADWMACVERKETAGPRSAYFGWSWTRPMDEERENDESL